MELKKYQRAVIADLTRYLELMTEKRNIAESFNQFWFEKGLSVGFGNMKPYQNVLPCVP